MGSVAVVVAGDTRGAVGGEAEGSELDVVGSVELAVVFAGCFGNGLVFFGRQVGRFLDGGFSFGFLLVTREGDIGAGFEKLFPELVGS